MGDTYNLPPHVVAAVVSHAAEVADGVLTGEERELVTILAAARQEGDGPGDVRLTMSGPDELLDRIEAALYPDDKPDGPAPAASSEPAARPIS